MLLASQLRTKCSKTSYTVCVYTHGAKEKFHETNVSHYVEWLPSLFIMTSLLILSSILLYIYIANVNSNRSLFQSLVQHSLSRKLYRIAEYIFVVGKRLNDGWKINSEVVLVRKPSSFLFLKKLVPFIYRNNWIFTNHGFVMHVQNPGIGKLIDQTLEICTYIYIYIYARL